MTHTKFNGFDVGAPLGDRLRTEEDGVRAIENALLDTSRQLVTAESEVAEARRQIQELCFAIRPFTDYDRLRDVTREQCERALAAWKSVKDSSEPDPKSSGGPYVIR